jgi:hypothetical protein
MGRSAMFQLLSRLGFITVTAGATVAVPITTASAATRDERPSDADDADGADDDGMPAGSTALAVALHHLPPFEATELAAAWASSPQRARRLAIADALALEFALIGHDVMIDHLSRDRDPVIRFAAARAAWSRQPTGGDDGVLARLASDPNAAVRALARLANGR